MYVRPGENLNNLTRFSDGWCEWLVASISFEESAPVLWISYKTRWLIPIIATGYFFRFENSFCIPILGGHFLTGLITFLTTESAEKD